MKSKIFGIILFLITFNVINSQNVTYLPSNLVINNPEIGFYHYTSTGSSGGYNLINQSTVAGYRTSENITVVQRQFFLRDFITGIPITSTYLTNMQTDFNRIRAAGAKVIVRFTYTSSSSYTVFQPTKAKILAHITQLAPVVNANKDVIVAIQAGFIGKYGEWYYTGSTEFGNADYTQYTTTQWTNRKKIMDAMINSFHISIPLQVRYVYAKQKMYGLSYVGRIGFYNDAFLASYGDSGTFLVSGSQGVPSATDVVYWQTNTVNNPVSGETNVVNSPRTDCPNATLELNKFNWSLINKDYFPTVISNWQTAGCFSEIQKKLGYRYELINSNITNNVLTVNVKNTGWTNVFRERKTYLVFQNTLGTEYKFEVGSPNQWLEGLTKTISVPLNYNLPIGTYKLYLYMPDPNSTNVNYAIQFSNVNTWIPTNGYNDLFQTVTVNSALARTTNSVKIFDMSGVFVGDNIDNLQQGIYIVKTISNDTITTYKIKR
jgi:hypothetical protein